MFDFDGRKGIMKKVGVAVNHESRKIIATTEAESLQPVLDGGFNHGRDYAAASTSISSPLEDGEGTGSPASRRPSI